MRKSLINAFSAGMLPAEGATVVFTPLTGEQARALAMGAESAVGHADVAAIFSATLGVPVQMNRATLTLAAGDRCLLGQYVGPRLPEGCKTLPEGAVIRWLAVEVQPLPA